MEKKNPLIAGLLNMAVPGSGYLYVNNDPWRFIKTFFGGIAAIVVLVLLGNYIQNNTDLSFSQGVCPGILLLIVFVPLFRSGQKNASRQNRMMDNAARYGSKQDGNAETQLAKNQEMRDKNMISEQEYQNRKDNISSNK